jgi:5'(3')-deoxyribonucleotidase
MTRRVWLDCDGILAEFVPAYLALVTEHTGRVHRPEDVTAFELHKCVTTKEEDNFIWQNLIDRPGFITNMVDIPGAAEAVAELRIIAKVGCLTSPHLGPFWMHERAQWLLARGFSKRDIIFASDKSHVRGDVLIDDRKDNCIDWAKANPSGFAILMDCPWNQGSAPYCIRARGWPEVVRLVRNAVAAMDWPKTLPDAAEGTERP